MIHSRIDNWTLVNCSAVNIYILMSFLILPKDVNIFDLTSDLFELTVVIVEQKLKKIMAFESDMYYIHQTLNLHGRRFQAF